LVFEPSFDEKQTPPQRITSDVDVTSHHRHFRFTRNNSALIKGETAVIVSLLLETNPHKESAVRRVNEFCGFSKPNTQRSSIISKESLSTITGLEPIFKRLDRCEQSTTRISDEFWRPGTRAAL